MDWEYQDDCSGCPCCEYVNDGDYYCYEIDAFVIVNWEPTEYNGSCI